MPDVTGAADGPLPHTAERSRPKQGENGRRECSKFVRVSRKLVLSGGSD